MTRVAQIWRHPIKGIGREAVDTVSLDAGRTMPFDRVWAVAHEAAKVAQGDGIWASCNNFLRAAKAPELMAVSAVTDTATGHVRLSHPKAGEITIDPSDPKDAKTLLRWVAPLCPSDRAAPAFVYRTADRGMTDTSFPSISIANLASLDAFNAKAGLSASTHRFRANIWVEGAEPWAEHDWVGKTLTIGGATLKVRDRIERCLATTANPETGVRDMDILGHLNTDWGHQDFSVAAEVVSGGTISVSDTVEL